MNIATQGILISGGLSKCPSCKGTFLGPVDVFRWGIEEEEQTRRIEVLTPGPCGFAMPRLMLSDELWSKLEKILFQQAIYHKPDLRMTVEGMLYRMRVGCPGETCPAPSGAGIRSTSASTPSGRPASGSAFSTPCLRSLTLSGRSSTAPM